MASFPRLIFSFLFALLFTQFSFSQDSLAIQDKKVQSRKIGEGRYELLFNLKPVNGWQLYAPGQLLLDINTTELRFADSSVIQESPFTYTPEALSIKSPLFTESLVKVFEGATQWKCIIRINGTVPANLQGELLYTYGKQDEFYPSRLSLFHRST